MCTVHLAHRLTLQKSSDTCRRLGVCRRSTSVAHVMSHKHHDHATTVQVPLLPLSVLTCGACLPRRRAWMGPPWRQAAMVRLLLLLVVQASLRWSLLR